MRYLLLMLVLLVGCAKPADPTKSPYPVYGSVTVVTSGVEVACENCVILEVNNRALRVTFTDNGVDECSGEGSLSYLSSDTLDFPENDGDTTLWSGTVVGDNAGKSLFCFPDILDLQEIKQLSSNLFLIDYNGKAIKVKKLN